MTSDSTELRQAIIDACRKMNTTGINQGTSGNISVRVGPEMLITPSGVDYDAMTPGMIVSIPLDDPGSMRPGQYNPSSEWQFHRDLLNARPDMNAVVHAHPVYCTALAMNRQEIPACHYMVAAFGGAKVPLASYEIFGSDALSQAITTAMQRYHGCLMANHGAIVVGEDLERALWRMIELETLAKGYTISLGIGRPHILSKEEIAAVLVKFQSYGLQPVRKD